MQMREVTGHERRGSREGRESRSETREGVMMNVDRCLVPGSPWMTAWHVPWIGIGVLLFWGIGIPARGLMAGWLWAREQANKLEAQ